MKIQRETLPNMGKQTKWEDLRPKSTPARCQIPLKVHNCDKLEKETLTCIMMRNPPCVLHGEELI